MENNKYKNRDCAYCGGVGISETADNVFAKGFFSINRREHLPKIPACDKCNNAKSSLENDLMPYLAFGGRHVDAYDNLSIATPPRLKSNAKINQKIRQGMSEELISKNGILQKRMTVPFEGKKLQELFSYIVKGLAWFHMGVLLNESHTARAGYVTSDVEELFNGFMAGSAKKRASNALGIDTFKYEGLQLEQNPEMTIWKFSIFGGIEFVSNVKQSTHLWGMTGLAKQIGEIYKQ